jgi:hypothetical protein
MIREIHTAMDQLGAFAFEQAALEAGKGLADRDSAACGNNSMPGNSLAARARSHGVSSGTSAAAEPSRTGQLAVGDYASLGNAPDQSVDLDPALVHMPYDNRSDRRFPLLPL